MNGYEKEVKKILKKHRNLSERQKDHMNIGEKRVVNLSLCHIIVNQDSQQMQS